MFNDLKILCFAIAAFWCLISTTTCSYKSNQVQELKSAREKDSLTYQVEIARLQKDAKAKEAEQAKTEARAYEKFAKDLQNVNDLFNERMRDIGGVHQTVRETVKYLPSAPVEVREKIATATADGLIEGTALLVEVEAVARQYDAELELCIARQADPLKDGAVEEVELDQLE